LSAWELCRGDGVGDREQLEIVAQQVEHLTIEPQFSRAGFQ
jgi:hypothetical protein